MKLRTILLGLSALFVAFNAAFFSITGLSQLFAGATLSVILMASSLELAKLIAASFLYNYWKKINKALRAYLFAGVVILIIITSAGIYGFLTAAFQSTSDKLDVLDNKTELLELRKDRFESQVTTYTNEEAQLSNSINELTKGLSNNVIQYRDSASGKIITTTSSNTRRVLERQLNDFKSKQDIISVKKEIALDSITAIDIRLLNLQTTADVTSDIGALVYLSKVTGKPMSTVINWFALFIIFVFDPLAVGLIVAFNTALRVDRGEHPTTKKVQETPLKEEPVEPQLVTSPKDVATMIEANESPPEPNEALKKAAETYKSEGVKETLELHQGENEHEFYEGKERTSYTDVPYYTHPEFEWDETNQWLGDRAAENYWIRHRGGSYQAINELRQKNK